LKKAVEHATTVINTKEVIPKGKQIAYGVLISVAVQNKDIHAAKELLKLCDVSSQALRGPMINTLQDEAAIRAKLEKSPSDAESLLKLAELSFITHDLKTAESCSRKVLEVSPPPPILLECIALETLLMIGNDSYLRINNRIQKRLNELLSEIYSVRAIGILCNVFADHNVSPDAAVRSFRTLLPDFDDKYLHLLLAQRFTKPFSIAAPEYMRLNQHLGEHFIMEGFKEFPKASAAFYMRLSLLYFHLGKLCSAVECADLSQRIAPNCAAMQVMEKTLYDIHDQLLPLLVHQCDSR
jgi:tetratricopeptide (TPR) repeat protein